MTRNYKGIIAQVIETKQPVILSTQDQAEAAAIVSMEDLEKLQELKHRESAKALLKLAELAEQLPRDPAAPTDVSTNHDYYAWGGEKREPGA